MLVSIVKMRIKKEKVFVIDKAFGGRKNMLDKVQGFRSVRLIKDMDDEQNFGILSIWDSLDDLMAWKNRPVDPNRKRHGGGNYEDGNSALLEGKPEVLRYEVLSESVIG